MSIAVKTQHEAGQLNQLENAVERTGALLRYIPLQRLVGAWGGLGQHNGQVVIEIDQFLQESQKIEVIVHELVHWAGNIDYVNYTRETAELLTDIITEDTLKKLGARVTYITNNDLWRNRDKVAGLRSDYSILISEVSQKVIDAING